MSTRREWLLPLVGAAILVATVALPGQGGVSERRAPHGLAVTQSSYACPTPKGVLAATGRLAVHSDAKTQARTLPERRSVPELASTTAWASADPDGKALLVTSQDPEAAGAVGFTGEVAGKGDGGGLAVASCPGVVQDAWYVGAGSGAKHFTTLTLTNLAGSPAVADVTLWGESGPVDAVDADGIVLKAFQSRRIEVASLAAGEPELGIHVESSRGAMSVSVRDTSTAVFGGTEAIPATAAPARRQAIAGLAKGAGTKRLLLLNPGDSTARTKVELLGKNGAIVPAGLESIKVPSGRLTTVDLPASVGRDPAAVRLTSDQPVTASLRQSATNKDYAYAVASPRLAGPSIVPLSIGKLVDDASLVLSAPGRGAAATVTAYDSTMRQIGSTEVTLTASSTAALDLTAKKTFGGAAKNIAYVVVRPSGNVIGSTIYQNGNGFSALPLDAAPLTALTPDVRPGH